MIQRIQSIYLFLAAAVLGAQFVIPYASAPANTVADASATFSDGIFDLSDRLALLILSSIAIGLVIAAFFLFKNRTVQSRIASLGMYASSILALTLAYNVYFLIEGAGPAMSDVHYQAGLGMPALAMLLLWFANKAIRKDEALVRSSDRLR